MNQLISLYKLYQISLLLILESKILLGFFKFYIKILILYFFNYIDCKNFIYYLT